MYETAIMGVIMHTLFEQIVGVSAPKIYRYGYVYAALDENDQDDKHPNKEVSGSNHRNVPVTSYMYAYKEKKLKHLQT